MWLKSMPPARAIVTHTVRFFIQRRYHAAAWSKAWDALADADTRRTTALYSVIAHIFFMVNFPLLEAHEWAALCFAALNI